MKIKQIEETSNFLRRELDSPPNTAVVLGSGLGRLIQNLKELRSLPYSDIPYFTTSKVSGHTGKFTVGFISSNNSKPVQVAFLEGRSHYYEGYTMKELAYPVYVLKNWGIKNLILTNAAGGINRNFKPGDLMLITDHINLMGSNPLIGPHYEKENPGLRFQDLSEPYSHRLLDIARKTAQQLKILHREGVYAAWSGPAYETAAEIRFLGIIGADAVGMSTVPEVIAANHANLEVLAISCLTNMATGLSNQTHKHEEILKTAQKSSQKFCSWLEAIIPLID